MLNLPIKCSAEILKTAYTLLYGTQSSGDIQPSPQYIVHLIETTTTAIYDSILHNPPHIVHPCTRTSAARIAFYRLLMSLAELCGVW